MATDIVKRLLNFDKMITPAIIKFIYGIAIGLSVLYGLSMIISGLGSHYGGGFKVIMGLITIIISPFITRIWCETMIVIFKINENLSRIADKEKCYEN